MRNNIYLLGVLTLVACGGKDGGDTDTTTPADPCVEGNICTFAGVPGSQQFGPEGVAATESPLNLPVDVTVSPDGDVYIVDFNNHRIRLVDSGGIVNTVTGTGMLGDGVVDELGAANPGPALDVAWNHPTNAAFAPGDSDNLWVAAWHNSRVNRLSFTDDYVYFEVGDGSRAFGGDGGDGAVAQLDLPAALTFDDAGNMYISDQANQIIRKVDTSGIITTIAGTPKTPGYSGDGGPATSATLHALVGQAADPSSRIAIDGNLLYLADTRNQVIRVIDLDTGTIDRVAGNYVDNGKDPVAELLAWGGVEGYEGDGGDPLDARFANPRDLIVGPSGELYIADTDNHCIRVIQDGVIDTFAGTCGVEGNDAEGVPAKEALMRKPYGIDLGPNGELYIADMGNHAIRVVK